MGKCVCVWVGWASVCVCVGDGCVCGCGWDGQVCVCVGGMGKCVGGGMGRYVWGDGEVCGG